MALRDPSPKLTYADYLLFPNDGKRHEILGGEHFVTAAPFLRHQRIAGRLYFHIEAFLRLHPLGELFFAPADVLLSPHDIVQPDLLFVSNEREAILTEANIQGAPDLVVEILSNSTRRLDEVLKRRAYEQFGAQEYWIFDPSRKTAQVWERTGEGLRRRPLLSAAEGDILKTPLLPGLEISLAEIFAGMARRSPSSTRGQN